MNNFEFKENGDEIIVTIRLPKASGTFNASVNGIVCSVSVSEESVQINGVEKEAIIDVETTVLENTTTVATDNQPLTEDVDTADKTTSNTHTGRKVPTYMYKGKLLTANEISKITGINKYTFKGRIDAGMSVEEAAEKSPNDPDFYLYKGELMTATEISKITGINSNTFRGRVSKGMSVEEAATNINYRKLNMTINGGTPKKISYNHRSARRYTYKGKTYTIGGLSKISPANIGVETLRYRLLVSKMSVEDAVTTPVYRISNRRNYKKH